jgi:hypothetical protein
LGDIIDDNGTVGITVVHGRKRLVTLLASGIPDLELDSSVFVEGDRLSEESGADGRFSERVELILVTFMLVNRLGRLGYRRKGEYRTLTNRSTIELWMLNCQYAYSGRALIRPNHLSDCRFAYVDSVSDII